MATAAPPKDLTHHYSRVVQRTQASVVKKFYKYYSIAGIANLAGGLPNSVYFPYDTLEAQIAPSDRFTPSSTDALAVAESQGNKSSAETKSTASSHITVPHDSQDTDRTRKIDVTTALQYGTSSGYPALAQWVRDFARINMHPNVPYAGGPETILTLGCTDGLAKALYMFTEIWDDRKDWIRNRQGVLVEEFTFMNSVQAMKPRGLNVVPVAIDEQGLLAEGADGLRDVLENWDRSKGKLPHLLYTIPNGQNPTGGTLSIERRKQVYDLCSKYDIIIIEDDPYWFLQYPSANDLSVKYRGKPIVTKNVEEHVKTSSVSSGYSFLDSLVPSYLSVDTDGRVMRLDTFSKTVAPGCRLGWITTQPAFAQRIGTFTDLLTQQPSGFVQAMVAELLIGQQTLASQKPGKTAATTEQNWHTDGFVRWIEGLRGVYERRMQVVVEALQINKYKVNARAIVSSSRVRDHDFDDFEIVSKTQIYDFNIPMGGMFLWLRMCFENHPLYGNTKTTVSKLSQAFWIFATGDKYKVILGPGTMFSPTDKIKEERGLYYFRVCFAAVTDAVLEKASKCLAQAGQDFFDIDDVQKIEDLISDDDDSTSSAKRMQMNARLDQMSFVPPTMC